MLGRTMHGIDYDERRDEIVVPQQFGQAILIFKGSAAGETRPVSFVLRELAIERADKTRKALEQPYAEDVL